MTTRKSVIKKEENKKYVLTKRGVLQRQHLNLFDLYREAADGQSGATHVFGLASREEHRR